MRGEVHPYCSMCMGTSYLMDLRDPHKPGMYEMRIFYMTYTGCNVAIDSKWPFFCKKCYYSIKREREHKTRALNNNPFEALRKEEEELVILKKKTIFTVLWSEVHWSVKQLSVDYKEIKVPFGILKKNICPTVALTRCNKTDIETCSTEQSNKQAHPPMLRALRHKAEESKILKRKKFVILLWSDVHWSVKQLSRDYKNISVPRSILKKNICPTVALTRCIKTDIEICSTEQSNKRRRLPRLCAMSVKSYKE